jgi:uncharacterized protein YndB with AHSA1/START domain
MKKTIQRGIIINASKENIYAVIATPELVTRWFSETIEGNYTVGT